MRKRILLVDDTLTITAMERIILGDAYDYSEARNGAEALRRAIDELPDLILMDIDMPVQDGIAGLRSIKAEERTQHIPVVMVSTHRDAVSIDTCRALGCADFVNKPIDRNLLTSAVRRLIGEGA